METAVVVAELAATAISAYGEQQQAATATHIANYNYALQKQSNAANAQYAQYQANLNSQIAQSQYQAQQNNAITLDNQAQAMELQTRAQVSRLRDQQDRMMGHQMAQTGASGVTTEGSPLAVLSDNAGLNQRAQQDTLAQGDLQAAAYTQQAADARYKSGFSLLDSSLQNYQGQKALFGQQSDDYQAQIERYSGLAKANSYMTSSYGTLLSGFAKAI